MSKSRTQKAALNTITMALAEIVQLICGLILPRLILASFGSAYNGITSSARQFLDAVSILTIGVTGSTRVALYRSLADKNIEKTNGILRATEKYMQKVGLVLCGLLIILTGLYPVLVDTGYTWIEVAPLIIAAGISAAGRYFFGMPASTLLTADQSVYVSNICLIIANISNVISSYILIKLGCNIQTVKLVSSSVLLLNPCLRALYIKKKYKLNKKCKPDNTALSMRRDAMAHSIANIVHDHTDIVVLTVFCNVKIVSVYTVYNLVMSALKKTQKVFTSGTESIFGNMWAKGELDKIKYNLGLYEQIIATFVSIVFSTAFIMILPFIFLYTKGVHDVEYILPSYAIVIIAAQMFYSFRTPYITLVQGVGHYKQTKNGAYMEAAINLVLSVVFVQFFGIVGVAIGTLAANLFRTIQYALYIDKNLIPRGKSVFLKRIIWALGNMGIIIAISNNLANKYAYSGKMAWIITAFIVALFSIAVTAISSLIFFRKDSMAILDMAKRVITKKNKKKKKE